MYGAPEILGKQWRLLATGSSSTTRRPNISRPRSLESYCRGVHSRSKRAYGMACFRFYASNPPCSLAMIIKEGRGGAICKNTSISEISELRNRARDTQIHKTRRGSVDLWRLDKGVEAIHRTISQHKGNIGDTKRSDLWKLGVKHHATRGPPNRVNLAMNE